MDSLEECRPLYLNEWNFRLVMKNQLLRALRYRNIYWRKRHTINRIRLGDDCIKYFYAMATISYRRNVITQLKDHVDNVIMDHESKAALIWTSFKNRMGITTEPVMQFHLSALIQSVDLQCLVQPFTAEEIDLVVKCMPPDKAPGPDGFNGLFMKKCWPLIKDDFYKLCQDFFEGIVDIEPINNSFIILVPKYNNPEGINDYRPISLLNCSIKLITKILADRLQLVILKLLHDNQYGFIRSRTIQDCLASSFEYIHQCHQSKREVVILKLDFAKAFDTIEHSAMMLIMEKMGFPARWL